ncbi:4-(cytidine 5'-diphospho)-2-C-methyl-D-erythritol kinase [Methylobrevis pamukkalensis]|uniref:4-diphosphocytidyl-2-C-methyl-D-erythritol kinase n=1 Tax=Methylobrevis pamukkalensis TaxID=1439726 RepID=A0A1E3GXV9_9HYPH|nr:4-(cytidine 5'-diphospho)-2-C-methyl-D-erythritol kinase [Methylobrevis pamukkalensis]ODN68898.1 4-diphosphocytidyl-2-C-methyl-D-erythritol kinase [Methylobrevis pamukkalensis]
MSALTETARAKVNLALHVVGRRADGYHLLDTLAVFPPVGDVLTLEAAGEGPLNLSVTGPMAGALAGLPPESNLALRGARLALAAAGIDPEQAGLALTLEKHLPAEAGIGGGSADAAAAIRLVCRRFGLDPLGPAILEAALRLGADVPMCLHSRPLRARGIGETITPLGALPAFGLLLANPGIATPTPEIFRRLETRTNPPIADLPAIDHAGAVVDALAAARNDLQAPAIAFAPAIGALLADLANLPDVLLARMSGSGSTCLALFAAPARRSALRPYCARQGLRHG